MQANKDQHPQTGAFSSAKKQRVRRRKKAGRWVRVEPVHRRTPEELSSQRFQLGAAPSSAVQLSKLLDQRRSSSELSERNIIQQHSIAEQRRKAALHLGRKLRSRPAMSSLVNKGLLKASSQHGAPGNDMLESADRQGRKQLLRGFRNRRTRQQLVHLGIARPLAGEHTDAVPERALSPSSAKAAADLDRALASRPSREDLLSTGVMPTDAVVWAPLEADWNSATGSSFPPPSARNCHTFDLVRGQILLVAGHSMPDSSTVPYCLDLRNAKWQLMLPDSMAYSHGSDDHHATMLRPAAEPRSAAAEAAAAAPMQHATGRASSPCARYAHATTECCGSLLLMGGYGNNKWLNDVWSFDCTRQQWHIAQVANSTALANADRASFQWPSLGSHISSLAQVPAPRAAHTLTAIPVQAWARAIESARHVRGCVESSNALEEACAVLFGGNDKSGLFNDVWLLRQLPCADGTESALPLAQLIWLKPIVVGDTPTPRAGHTAVLFGASLIVFGGSRGWGTEAFNDLHVLDVGNIRPWLQPPESTTPEDPVQDADSLVFWYRPRVSGKLPAARAGHTATLIGNNMLVFGGADSVQCFQDLHVLDCSSFSWSTPITSGLPPKARSMSAAVAVGDTMVIFGGSTFTGELLNDVFLLETDYLGRTIEVQSSGAASRRLRKQRPVTPRDETSYAAAAGSAGKHDPVAGPLQSATDDNSARLALIMHAYSSWKADLARVKALVFEHEKEQQARFEKLISQAAARF